MQGICFVEHLFHKVVKGEKTQTRRIIFPEPIILNDWVVKPKSKYIVGEIVYLKEPYVITGKHIIYKFGSTIGRECDKAGVKWSNKLFMPESAARYFVKITAVRAERLQDISGEDCFKEGIEIICKGMCDVAGAIRMYGLRGLDISENTPQKAYATLINKINGKGTWEKNPFVWVYDFKLHQS